MAKFNVGALKFTPSRSEPAPVKAASSCWVGGCWSARSFEEPPRRSSSRRISEPPAPPVPLAAMGALGSAVKAWTIRSPARIFFCGPGPGASEENPDDDARPRCCPPRSSLARDRSAVGRDDPSARNPGFEGSDDDLGR
jgi:hypothetical protein